MPGIKNKSPDGPMKIRGIDISSQIIFSGHKLLDQRGVALVLALFILVIMTFLGLASIFTSGIEMEIAGNEKSSTQALYLAEAGVSKVISWFQNPQSFQDDITRAGVDPSKFIWGGSNPYNPSVNPLNRFFEKRRIEGGNLSFISSSHNNLSQFTDTGYGEINADGNADTSETNPALGIDPDNSSNTSAMREAQQAFLNEIFKSLAPIGRIKKLIIYGASAGEVCTVRVTAETVTGARRTIEQVLGAGVIPGMKSAIETRLGANWNGHVNVHWGRVYVGNGSADFGNQLKKVPYKVTASSLSEAQTIINQNLDYGSTNNKDLWLEMYISGSYQNPSSIGTWENGSAKFSGDTDHKNLFEHVPNIEVVVWDYNKLKQFAIENGYYYRANPSNGMLYKGDVNGSFTGTPVSFEALTNGKVNEFIFIDNPDDPKFGGSTHITFTASGNYWTESNIYMVGSLRKTGSGTGKNFQAQTPPWPDPETGTRINVSNLNVHYKGALYVTGRVDAGGNFRIFGGVVAEQGFAAGGNPSVWYNYDLSTGRLSPNFTVVTRKTWREIY